MFSSRGQKKFAAGKPAGKRLSQRKKFAVRVCEVIRSTVYRTHRPLIARYWALGFLGFPDSLLLEPARIRVLAAEPHVPSNVGSPKNRFAVRCGWSWNQGLAQVLWDTQIFCRRDKRSAPPQRPISPPVPDSRSATRSRPPTPSRPSWCPFLKNPLPRKRSVMVALLQWVWRLTIRQTCSTRCCGSLIAWLLPPLIRSPVRWS